MGDREAGRPEELMPKITELYAFVTDDTGPDDEGLCSFSIGGSWMPMVGANPKRIDSLRPIAKEIAEETGKKIKILRFTVREEIEVIEP